MNAYCNSLNFNVYPLNGGITLNPHPTHIRKLNLSLINPALTYIFDSLGVKVVSLQHLSYPPYFTGTIHIDNEGGDYIKLNWIFNGFGSTVNWYKPISDIKKNKCIAGNEYVCIKYDSSEVELLYSHQVILPSLIQVGIPHNIINYSEPRECLSMVLCLNGKRITMSESIELFKNYIV